MRKKIRDKEVGLRIMNLRLDHGYSRERLAERAESLSSFCLRLKGARKVFQRRRWFVCQRH